MKFNKRICAAKKPVFDLEIGCYPGPFTLEIQTQVKQHAAAGNQSIPFSVRFQACNDRTCLPPKNRSPLSAHRDSSRHMITRD